MFPGLITSPVLLPSGSAFIRYPKMVSLASNVVIDWLACMLYVQEVLGSYIISETGWPGQEIFRASLSLSSQMPQQKIK